MMEDMDFSILAVIDGFTAPIFAPLGFGNWQAAVATLMPGDEGRGCRRHRRAV